VHDGQRLVERRAYLNGEHVAGHDVLDLHRTSSP
jgi:hypothetical protein